MESYPAFVHSWTQSDRLAIAMNFQLNGFDFFHPATFNLLTKEGITQVDFPIHDYLIAIISYVFSIELISTFRYYNLLFALIGWIFLYKAFALGKASAPRALFMVFFISTLPFLSYYENGFLPSIPSLANFCIGLFFILKYLNTERHKHYLISILFLTLAALSRIPFSIFLLAVLMERLYQMLLRRIFSIKEIIYPILGLIAVFGYFLYNQSLAKEYGSMFLTELMHPESIEDFFSIISSMLNRWSGELLSPFHLIFLLILIIVFFKQKGKSSSQSSKPFLAHYASIAAAGVLIYFLLMGRQFVDHDYYFVDSFLPLFILFVLWLNSNIEFDKKWYVGIAVLSIIFVFNFYSYARSSLNDRYSKDLNGSTYYTYQTFVSSKSYLENIGITKSDTIAIFDIGSTNLPFTILENRGYTSLSSGEKSAKKLLNRDFDYAILIDSFKISDSYFDYPEIANELKYIGDNGQLSVYQKSKGPKSQFFKNLLYQYQNNFDNKKEDSSATIVGWERQFVEEKKSSALKISPTTEYDLTSSLRINDKIEGKSLRVAINADFFPTDSVNGMQLIISFPPYYFAYYLESELKEIAEWQNKTFIRSIPSKYGIKGKELKVYLWNPTAKNCLVDNYHLIVYE